MVGWMWDGVTGALRRGGFGSEELHAGSPPPHRGRAPGRATAVRARRLFRVFERVTAWIVFADPASQPQVPSPTLQPGDASIRGGILAWHLHLAMLC